MNDSSAASSPVLVEDGAITEPPKARATESAAAAEAALMAQRPRRGRRPGETPAERLERLQRALAEAKVAAKEAQRRTCEAVGSAVLAEAENDPQLKARLRDILDRRITGHQARVDIASLLRELQQ